MSAPGALMPFDTVEDYRDNVARHAAAAAAFDQSIGRLKTGATRGITLPRVTVELMIRQLDTQLQAEPSANPYLAPLRAFPDSFSDAEKARLEKAKAAEPVRAAKAAAGARSAALRHQPSDGRRAKR